MARNNRIGSSLEDFLREEGVYDEARAIAIKRVLAWQLADAMKASGVTKVEMARRMKTSRSQLDRLLDPENAKIRLDTLYKAASALGRELKLELV